MSTAILTVFDYYRELAALQRQRPWYYEEGDLPTCRICDASFDGDSNGQAELERHIEKVHEA